MNKSELKARSSTLTWLAPLVLICALSPAVVAQTLTLDTPSDLEHARIKADKAWKAWEAQGHIESKLLSMPADKAITEIRKDDKLAEQYLAAREVQVKLLSDDFRRRATAIEANGAAPDLTKVQKSEEQGLAALIEGDLKHTSEVAKIEKDTDPGQREAKRAAAEKETEYYKELADDVRKRLAVLQSAVRSDEQYGENERALIDTLKRLSETLEEQGAAFAREREDWQSYHKHLEEVVIEHSRGSGPSTSLKAEADDAEPATSALKLK